MASNAAEDGIRTYLEALERPAPKPTVDRAAVKALKDQAKAETDPINKLKLLAQAEEAGRPQVPEAEDLTALEATFVAEAKAWAEEEGIPVSAFQALKVPDDVLRRAGFSPSGVSGVTTGGRRTRQALALTDVKAAIGELPHLFKISQLAESLGRDTAVVAGKVKALLDEGYLLDKGKDPNHSVRGPAPTLYAKA